MADSTWLDTYLTNFLSTTSNTFADYLGDMNEYAARRLAADAGLFGANPHGLAPPEYDFPENPEDVELGVRTDLLIDVPSNFPIYTPPSWEPDIEGLYQDTILEKKRIWISTSLDDLINIIDRMAAGDTAFFSQNYQQNVFDLDLDRKLQALDDSLRMIAAKHAARGFKAVNSYLATQENELYQKYYFDRSNQSREIVKIVEEAARDFIKYGIEKGLSYEELNMTFTNEYNKLILTKLTTIIDAYLKNIEATINLFKAEVSAILAEFDTNIKAWELTGQYNKTVLEANMAPWQKYKLRVDAAVAKGELDFKTWMHKVTVDIEALKEGVDNAAKALNSVMATNINLTTSKA